MTFLTIFIAIFGLSFLIFIHELGHYWMAKRVGMRIEVFSIGFGKPLFWRRRENGELWQIGWLLFGGYVKIAGMESSSSKGKAKEKDIYTVSGGFFSKSPLARIQVALAGPLTNILFAFLCFALIWAAGGREKSFSEVTPLIGWVDPSSPLYREGGVHPGDEIVAYNEESYHSSKDHLFAPLISGEQLTVHGIHHNYLSGSTVPFELRVTPYPHPAAQASGMKSIGILQPAGYLIVDEHSPLPHGALAYGARGAAISATIEPGDRLLWADGEFLFSSMQLNRLLNDQKLFLTVRRADKILSLRVLRLHVQELRFDKGYYHELVDWQHDAHLEGKELQELFILPYRFSDEAVVEAPLRLLDQAHHPEGAPLEQFTELLPGDQILAVQGRAIRGAAALFSAVQKKQVSLIIDRSGHYSLASPYGDEPFFSNPLVGAVETIAKSIGSTSPVRAIGSTHLLEPMVPVKQSAFIAQLKASREPLSEEFPKKIGEPPSEEGGELRIEEGAPDPLLLGLLLKDRRVTVQKGPIELFSSIFSEITTTLSALISGNLSPKWISGPVGIVQFAQQQLSWSFVESCFWLAMISLNLGILNLLPIPMLDGGTVLLSLFEWISGRRISPSLLEKIIFPFATLLILFFLFLTYNDLSRLFSRLWR